jgi:hypothetical protein
MAIEELLVRRQFAKLAKRNDVVLDAHHDTVNDLRLGARPGGSHACNRKCGKPDPNRSMKRDAHQKVDPKFTKN